ncbi:nickel ABC transporter, nickel/metallophore periplasmic binding protein [Campylobacter jejuni]|nr:nickel ABC transporter, nickel/metallophore periplasmic binding protein [Campylobacter jejuni]
MLRFLIFAMLLFVNLEAKIPKDTLIIAVENEIARINPAYSEDHDAVINLVFSGLTRFDENMSFKT